MTEHTPGPWALQGDQYERTVTNSDDTILIARIYTINDFPCAEFDSDEEERSVHAECEANAQLIVAAPDLHAWAIAAWRTLQRGVDLMPIDQLREWQGVRAILESCPVDYQVLVEGQKSSTDEVPV